MEQSMLYSYCTVLQQCCLVTVTVTSELEMARAAVYIRMHVALVHAYNIVHKCLSQCSQPGLQLIN